MNYEQVWKQITEIARQLIKQGFDALPGADTTARENYVVEIAVTELEKVDQALPVIGRFMDMPVIDWAQREAVRQLVRALVRREYAVVRIEQITQGENA